MAKRPVPGLAFSMQTGVGYLVGLFTHETPRMGPLVWVARPTFDQPPTLEEVGQIGEWRWPVLFQLGSAIRLKVVSPIGEIPIPEALQRFPTMRSGDRRIGWQAFNDADRVRPNLGRTTDASLPVYQIVNGPALRDMIETNWKPEDWF